MKLLKSTTDGTASQKSNEIHLKLDNCQLDRFFSITPGIPVTGVFLENFGRGPVKKNPTSYMTDLVKAIC